MKQNGQTTLPSHLIAPSEIGRRGEFPFPRIVNWLIGYQKVLRQHRRRLWCTGGETLAETDSSRCFAVVWIVDRNPRAELSGVMRRKYLLCFLWTALVLRADVFVAAEADPVILNGPELPHLQQVRIVSEILNYFALIYLLYLVLYILIIVTQPRLTTWRKKNVIVKNYYRIL